jgi:hypothetical protein
MGNFIIGLKVTAIGFTTVFVVLTVLMGIIYVMGSVLVTREKSLKLLLRLQLQLLRQQHQLLPLLNKMMES